MKPNRVRALISMLLLAIAALAFSVKAARGARLFGVLALGMLCLGTAIFLIVFISWINSTHRRAVAAQQSDPSVRWSAWAMFDPSTMALARLGYLPRWFGYTGRNIGGTLSITETHLAWQPGLWARMQWCRPFRLGWAEIIEPRASQVPYGLREIPAFVFTVKGQELVAWVMRPTSSLADALPKARDVGEAPEG